MQIIFVWSEITAHLYNLGNQELKQKRIWLGRDPLLPVSLLLTNKELMLFQKSRGTSHTTQGFAPPSTGSMK